MRPLIIALGLYIGMISWMLYNDHRATTAVHEAMTTVGFDHYIVWTCKHDRPPKEAVRKAEEWAVKVDPQTIDAVNVKAWVEWMQRRKSKGEMNWPPASRKNHSAAQRARAYELFSPGANTLLLFDCLFLPLDDLRLLLLHDRGKVLECRVRYKSEDRGQHHEQTDQSLFRDVQSRPDCF